jgi:RsmE family RNA methyltransferase
VNLVLLLPEDFVSEDRVILRGRRCKHIANVHRASAGDELLIGALNGKVGSGRIHRITPDEVEMTIALHSDPPPSLDVTLVIALPRPKVFNRVLAGATSMGVKRLFFVNAWRVEKSYWASPRLSEENVREQAIAGLEQARDTVMPAIELRRFFRRFVEDELPELAAGTTALVAHPKASVECPRHLGSAITLAIGPEGGFIDAEVASFVRAGFRSVSLGPRILRVETAVTALLSRLT